MNDKHEGELHARFWRPTLNNGVIHFPRPEDCTIRKFIRPMGAKQFAQDKNQRGIDAEIAELHMGGGRWPGLRSCMPPTKLARVMSRRG